MDLSIPSAYIFQVYFLVFHESITHNTIAACLSVVFWVLDFVGFFLH